MPNVYSLPYNPLRVTSFFGFRNIDIPGATKMHYGLDLGADKAIYKSSIDGGDVLAVADGIICNSYFNISRGWVIILDHGEGFKSLYQHLNKQGLIKGVNVCAGQPIGRMGATGVGSGLHLHLEFIVNGVRIDPLPYLLKVKKMDKIYEKINDVPDWYNKPVALMIELGGITPGLDGSIKISEDMCRIYTSFYKIGLLDALKSVRG